MLSTKVVDSRKKTSNGDGRLLQEIEALGQALYLNKNSSNRAISSSNSSDVRSKSVGKTHYPNEMKSKTKVGKEESLLKDKKGSIWNWKPLKAFSNIRNRRFNCCFSLQVHSIEGLSPNFNDVSLCVYWKRRDGLLKTRSYKVFQGMVDFEETLSYNCSIYGSGNGPHHSAKYEAKHCLLYASVVTAPELDLGKHRVDLTRLLPLTLEELFEENKSGKWTTSFKLSGKAKGSTLNVSFGFLIIGDDGADSRSRRNSVEPMSSKLNRLSTAKSVTTYDKSSARGSLRRTESLSGYPNQRSRPTSRSLDVKVLHEVLPTARSELSSSMSLLYKKLEEGELDSPTYSKPEFEVFSEDVELLKPKAEVDTFSEDPEPVKLKPNSEIYPKHVESLKPKLDSQILSKHIEPIKPESDMDLVSEHIELREPESVSWSDSEKETLINEAEETDFTVIEQGIEMSTKEMVKVEEIAVNAADDIAVFVPEFEEFNSVEMEKLKTESDPSPVDECASEYGGEASACHDKETNLFTDESAIAELESAFQTFSHFDSAGFDSPPAKSELAEQGHYLEAKSNYKAKLGRSLSMDAATESVACDFLDMLGIEHSPFVSSDSDPESPRERLLRQFEKEALAGGNRFFDFDIGMEEMGEDVGYNAPTVSGWGDHSEDFELSSIVQAAEEEHLRATEMLTSKTRAKMLEDLESESLMREWGLNEKAFRSSPPNSAGGFGSPIHFSPEEPLELPPLGNGLGPFVQTKDGGFLRSMSPSLFRNAKHSENLVMQVSSPVVVPAEMGSGIMDILQGLASVGIEKLSMQASKLMPLEDITGKTMQQVAWEATPSLEAPEREYLMQHETEVGNARSGKRKTKGRNSTPLKRDLGSEYVSVEDLAPLAMDKIEALSLEGLRIQSGMSDEDAPSNISPKAFGEISALQGKRANMTGSLGMEGAGGLQLLDIKDNGNEVDGLMGLSITLDEWMRLDAGIVDEEDQNSERTSKILAAHHANCSDMINGGWEGGKRKGKSSKKCGLLGNNFTVALMVQLRNPLRNYEPVGTPMLALIQVERVFVPPKPKIYNTVPRQRNIEEEEEDDDTEQIPRDEKVDEIIEDKKEEETIAQFKITEVHVAGLKTAPGKKKIWGTPTQQQSGSRWLLATGMGKTNKSPFMKSKAVAKSSSSSSSSQATTTTTVQPGETLWSISSRVHGTGSKWKELAALNPHIRNPNVIFPNEKIRLC
ncbi:hypothetical protein ACHQM5_001751 [Ranunculus cassubicifolius]